MRECDLVRAGLLLASLVLFCAGDWAFPGSAHAATWCEKLNAYPTSANPPRVPGEEIVVPVAVHMMKNVACPQDAMCSVACDSVSPSCQWKPPAIEKFLGPNGRLNQIWAAAKIRLMVVSVDECDAATLATLDVGVSPGQTFLPTLDPLNREWESRYHRVNREFSRPGVLNFYIWLRIGDPNTAAITYFGSSPLRGPESPHSPAVVWADIYCVRELAESECARKLAHEIGHALTLPHVDPVEGEADLGAAFFPSCPQGERSWFNLMRQNLFIAGGAVNRFIRSYTSITEGQKCRAREAARRLVLAP
jgi:hypothetical protein